jgi:citrate lyase subunit beta / citryl-CoA lyase
MLETNYLARTYLFVPGNRPDRFERALSSGADAVIVDLEDAVAPEAKDAAREAVAKWASGTSRAAGGWRGQRVLIRVNARGTPWFKDDAKLAAMDGVAGIVLPKTEQLDDIVELVSTARKRIAVFPLIETAVGMWRAMEIAKAPHVKRLMFGTLDFMVDAGIESDREALNAFRSQLVLTSRVSGLDAPVDGVTPNIEDLALLRADTLNGKAFGFGGKLCIHPKQVPIVEDCFQPKEDDIAWARRVVDAIKASPEGAVQVDGKMVDRPVMLRAQRLLNSVKGSAESSSVSE